MEIKVSEDKKPMTGTWYRSTIEPWCMGKVTKLEAHMCEVTLTGGRMDRCTINEFADSWELS
jgi:hypothetical protein